MFIPCDFASHSKFINIPAQFSHIILCANKIIPRILNFAYLNNQQNKHRCRFPLKNQSVPEIAKHTSEISKISKKHRKKHIKAQKQHI